MADRSSSRSPDLAGTREEQAAAHWIVALADGDADRATVDAFERWMDEDPRHPIAFDALCRVWRLLTPDPRIER